MFSICSRQTRRVYGSALSPIRGGSLAQPGQSHADVRRWRRERVPSPALAADRRQTGLSALRLPDLLRLSALGQPAALAMQSVSRGFLGNVGDPVRLAQAAAENLPDGHRAVLQRS